MPRQVTGRLGQQRRQVLSLDHLGNLGCLRKAAADRGQVARPAPIQTQARQRAVQVRHLSQRPPQILAKSSLFHRETHRVQPLAHHFLHPAGAGQATLQQARAAGGDGPVHRRQQ